MSANHYHAEVRHMVITVAILGLMIGFIVGTIVQSVCPVVWP